MRIEKHVVGPVAANCYFLIDCDTRHIAIIDPGGNADRLISRIESEGYIPEAVFLTHGHCDHAGGAAELAQRYGIKVYADEAEEETLRDPAINLSTAIKGRSESYRADVFLRDSQTIRVAGQDMIVLSTPGHTAGGCCFYLPAQSMVFTGDTLFCGSVGRTDFPGGSMSKLVRSVEDKLFPLDDDVIVYPGHDMASTIGREKRYNPYF